MRKIQRADALLEEYLRQVLPMLIIMHHKSELDLVMPMLIIMHHKSEL